MSLDCDGCHLRLDAVRRAETAEARVTKLEALLSEGREIVDEYVPGFTFWLKEAEDALTTSKEER